jgi:ferredoxin
MRTFVNPDLCISCGLCVDTCPEVYEMKDVAEVTADPVPADLEKCALEAEESCPVAAITHE